MANRMLPCPLHAAARRHAERPAVAGAEGVVTFGELERYVAAGAAWLRETGCVPGTRVAFYTPNGLPMIVGLFAVLRAGGVACPLSTRLPEAAVTAQIRRLKSPIVIGDLPLDAGGVVVLRPADLLDTPVAPDTSAGVQMDAGAPATILFTSGSTAEPKAAVHAYGNHYFNALGSNENIALGPGDRWLLSLPLYHVGGIGVLFRCLLAGATVVLPPSKAPLHETIARERVTHASLVATQLLRLLRTSDADVSPLKAVLLGGSAIPPGLLDAATVRGLPVHTSYGLTEMASQVTTTPPGATAAVLQSSGRVLPYREVRLAADGEIWVRGETRFLGYLSASDPDGLDAPFDDDGWFATRDLGRFGEDGLLYVLGRKDNLFISGGENIQPEEIEAELCRLDGVVQAVVVPVPDAEFGQRPAAFVRTDGRSVSAEWIAAQLSDRLPRFKIPRTILSWPVDLPEGMKPDRRRMAELAVRSLERPV